MAQVPGRCGEMNYRGDFAMGPQRGMAGGMIDSRVCSFPEPPPFRTYCNPAPFACGPGSCGTNGYQFLISAYGSSRPVSR